jgi:single-stranded DNA-binding protein
MNDRNQVVTRHKSDGVMFPNMKGNDRHPDVKGSITITSEQLRMLLAKAKANQANPEPDFEMKVELAGWERTSNSGKQYMSLAVEVNDYKPASAPPPPPPPVEDEIDDDDIPF